MGKKYSKEFEMEFGKKMQKAKDDPAVQKWWDEEQVQLDLDLVQGEDDSGIQWDELSVESKRELIMKIGYGSKQANALLSGRGPWRTWGIGDVALKLKKDLRKLGVRDTPGTILHKGRRLWKDLDNLEKMNVAGKYLVMKAEEENERMKEQLEKEEKKLEKLEKLAKRKAKWGF